VASAYLLGVSTRRVGKLVETLGIASLSKPVRLGNSMQCPDLRSSCATQSRIIVGCCRCRGCTSSCAVCSV
jgi:hypothetical protein